MRILERNIKVILNKTEHDTEFLGPFFHRYRQIVGSFTDDTLKGTSNSTKGGETLERVIALQEWLCCMDLVGYLKCTVLSESKNQMLK